jgi:WD40 repeat protein
VKVHTTKVTSISSASDGRFVISAANHVKLYDAKMRCIIAIDTKETLGVSDTISSLSWHAESRKIVIGTEGNEVWEISSEDGSSLRTEDALINSHAASPMAISPNPNGTTYATVGDDGFLKIWDAFNHDEHSSFDLAMPARACAFSPEGNLLAVGFGKEVKDSAKTINGRLVIIDVNDNSSYRIIAERRDSRKHIRGIHWHSSGDRLAVGADKIFVYALKTDTNPAINIDMSLIATIDITSPAIHFDFSKDGKYLRVNSGSNELLWVETYYADSQENQC